MKKTLFKKGSILCIILLFFIISSSSLTSCKSVEKPTLSTFNDDPGPDLSCDGYLEWVDIKPGATLSGEFTVENVGDSGTLLDWEIESYPPWGTWYFAPESGTGLTPEDGPIIVQMEVIAPEEPNSNFFGDLVIINSNNYDDYCSIGTRLITSSNLNSPLLEMMKNHFPLIYQIFRESLM